MSPTGVKTEKPRASSQEPPLQKQIEELGKSLASVTEFVQNEMARKAEAERAKKEAEVVAQREAAEKAAREKKERKRLEKLRQEELRVAEIDKRVELQVAIRAGEFFDKMEVNYGKGVALGKQARGKKQIVYLSDHGSSSGNGSNAIETEEIRKKTKKLAISEKRKRGAELPVEGSPPMMTPAKRTPKVMKDKTTGGSARVTRSKAKVKTKLSPYLARIKSPAPPSTFVKLRFKNQAMQELRGLDAQELQGICKNEGIVYNGKVDAIFDIASHRTRKAFDKEEDPIESGENSEQGEEDPTTAEEVADA
ncbi:hypothetical protein CBR_g21854 [Chara braunii]|uniref:Uncharacterized protein n=1 Tax=Chara braunii TaxID=69332 RepID=A0A388JUX1_CHABU|nr:hypothetical protein CBR_g21854 [Chara braunii]|eukprot:GBG61512.1 hypothetical protein CBR_g21854 [Chara braunii]